MLLQGRTALVFAAAGAIGSAVARRFAEEGARVFVSGRSAGSLAALGRELDAPWEVVDATAESEVSTYLERTAARTGIDVVFNAIGLRATEADYARRSATLSLSSFLLPLKVIAGSQFLTARASAPHMVAKKGGSIVMLSASLTGQFIPFMAGITAACGAVEGLTRTLAAELGPRGIRVNCVRAGGMPETRTIQETTANMAETLGASRQTAAQPTVANVLQRPLRVQEAAAMVAFLASDAASGIAGQVVNVCAGAIVSR